MNSFGHNFRITTFGESHGPAVGVVIDGVPPGLAIEREDIQKELDRRRPGQGSLSSPRNEADKVEILSGVLEGESTGAPVCLIVWNEDARPEDYEELKNYFRPGHGDLTWFNKYGLRDWRGGGRLSGRETVGRVAAGVVAREILKPTGLKITGHVVEVAGIEAKTFDPDAIETNPVRSADPEAAHEMIRAIEEARDEGDSVGGIVEVLVEGAPPGLGDPVFHKLDALLGMAMLSIGAVKAVEFGDGFGLAKMRGSEANDAILEDGFASNHAGGILGGISNGAPIVIRLAVKPTPSIALEQRTIDEAGKPASISVKGRHDPCIAPRIVPVAEAMAAIVLADSYLRQLALGP